MSVAVFIGGALQRTRDRVTQGAAKARFTGNSDLRGGRRPFAGGEDRRVRETVSAQYNVVCRRDRLERVLGDRVGFGLPIAHLCRARIDITGEVAAIGGVGDEQHLRALERELLDQVIEFRSEDALLAARRCTRIESGQDENVLFGLWVGTLEAFGLLRSAACDRQNDQIAGMAAEEQVAERAHHRGSVGSRVEQTTDVRDPAAA